LGDGGHIDVSSQKGVFILSWVWGMREEWIKDFLQRFFTRQSSKLIFDACCSSTIEISGQPIFKHVKAAVRKLLTT